MDPEDDIETSGIASDIFDSDNIFELPKAGKKPEPPAEDTQSDESQDTTDESQDKVEDQKIEKKPEPKVEDKPEPPKKGRDYTQFDPDLVPVLKKLDNRTFNLVKEHIFPKITAARAEKTSLESKLTQLNSQLAGKSLPQNWYEHPQGYVLSPEYTELDGQFRHYSSLSNHWKQQLTNIKLGKPWKSIELDNKGQLRLAAGDFEPSGEAEAQIVAAFNQAESAKFHISQKAQEFAKTFQSKYSSASEEVIKNTDAQLSKLPEDLRPLDEQVKTFVDVIPEVYQSHPMTKVAGKLFSVIMRQGILLRKHMDKSAATTINKADQLKAGPKSKLPTNGAKIAPKDVIDFEELERELTT